MGREQLNWVFAAGFAVVAVLGLALGVRLAGGARKTSFVATMANQTPLKTIMLKLDEVHKELVTAADDTRDGAASEIEAAARKVASYADMAIPELPPQTDQRKNDDLKKRLEQLIADAEDIADFVKDENSNLHEVPPMVTRLSKKCTRCHNVYRPEPK
jgi:hypothetical protein